ncbi:hypothetical protein HYU07_02985 [Candidatus Woesearchaeota archaeon]|nr:hypothetical protein [Candidatus Woesearchaeota archaeon]
MINKEINYSVMFLLAFLVVLPLANGGGSDSVNGCNEGCAALGTGGIQEYFCFENHVSMYQVSGNMIIGCDCSQTVGGRVGGSNTQFMMAYNNDVSYQSYYCDCNGNIRKFYTGDCTTEPTFEKWPETPIYTPPQDGNKYKCVDPDGEPGCGYERWDPPWSWTITHLAYDKPNYRLVCHGLENARWDPPAPLSSVDCGTAGGPAGGGSGGGTGGAAGSGTLATSALCGAPGCSIILRGSFIELDVPPDALKGSGTIVTTNNALSGTIITIMKEDTSLYINSENNILVVYRLIPQELAFALPSAITIGYDEDPAINEDRLDIYLYDEENNNWIAQNASINKEKNELTAHIGHLGVYAVIMAIDTEPPVTKDDYKYNNTWVNKNAVINLSATDDLSGVKETLYCIGNYACVPNISYKEPISITAEGIAYLKYYSVDNAGNKEEAKETIIKIDKTPPELSLALNPNQIWPPDHKEVSVKVNGYAVDSLSGVKINSFKLIDEYNEVKNTVNGFNTSIKLIAWRDGNDNDGRNYTITVESADNAGNNAITSAAVLVPHDQRK